MKLIEVYNNIIREQGEGQFAYTEKDSDYCGDIGVGLLIYCRETQNFLLLKRSMLVNEPLTWGIISGGINKSEIPLVALKREIREETKVIGGIKILKTPLYIYKDKNFKFYTFLGIVEKEFNPKLNWENTKFVWIPIDKIRSLKLHFGIKELISRINLKFVSRIWK